MINETEIQPEQNAQDYYEIDRMSNSALSNFKRSPRHYLWFQENKPEPTPAMVFGNAFHTYILENDKFKERYCAVPDDAPKRPTLAQWNAKKPSPETIVACDWWRGFNAENDGKITLSKDEHETLLRMSDAFNKHEPAMELLNEIGSTEVPLFWDDDVTGIPMKGKMDAYHPEFTLDLKTCMNAFPETFSIDAFNNGLHRQAALYSDGRERTGKKKGDFYFIACEKEPPYGISVMKCTREFIRHGRMVYGSLLEDVRYWIEMGKPNVGYEWKSPINGIHDLNLPSWIK